MGIDMMVREWDGSVLLASAIGMWMPRTGGIGDVDCSFVSVTVADWQTPDSV
jgi:hypothetical protein